MKWINFVNHWTGFKLLTIRQREPIWYEPAHLIEIDRDTIRSHTSNLGWYTSKLPKKILDKKVISRIIRRIRSQS